MAGYAITCTNPLPDQLLLIAGGNLDLVRQAIDAAALRGLLQRNKYEADLLDVVNYITAKRPRS